LQPNGHALGTPEYIIQRTSMACQQGDEEEQGKRMSDENVNA
jgi:hypothetical protein